MEEMHSCKFCNKQFRQERTIASHMCVKKRRHIDKDSVGSRLGFTVFCRFYELTTTCKKPKTFSDFVDSNYYSEFVKFGRHLVALNPIDINNFVDFVIKNGTKLKDWSKDYVYETYLHELTKKEPADRALERTILEMQTWANVNNEEYYDFFRKVNANEATYLIRCGKISPWVLYLAESADELFSRLNQEQGSIIQTAINPQIWHAKFALRKSDVDFVQTVLSSAGI